MTHGVSNGQPVALREDDFDRDAAFLPGRPEEPDREGRCAEQHEPREAHPLVACDDGRRRTRLFDRFPIGCRFAHGTTPPYRPFGHSGAPSLHSRSSRPREVREPHASDERDSRPRLDRTSSPSLTAATSPATSSTSSMPIGPRPRARGQAAIAADIADRRPAREREHRKTLRERQHDRTGDDDRRENRVPFRPQRSTPPSTLVERMCPNCASVMIGRPIASG